MLKLEREKFGQCVQNKHSVLCGHFLGMHKDQGGVFKEGSELKLHLSTKIESYQGI